MNFGNKVTLIAGASSGMGRALALRLAQEGAQLIVTARRKERLESLASEIRREGGQCLPLAADAQGPDAAAQVVAAGIAHFGRKDLAVLNAGGAPALDMRQMCPCKGRTLPPKARCACCSIPAAWSLRRLAFVSSPFTQGLWQPRPLPATACPHHWKFLKHTPLSTSCLRRASNARTTCCPRR